MNPASFRHDDPTQAIDQPPPQTRALPSAGRRPKGPRRGQIVVALALIAVSIGIGATAGTLTAGPDSAPVAAPLSSAPPSDAPIEVTISSLDPSGGSGLEQRGDDWRTQTYRTATFGGLKPGVGLVLDLGSPRAVTSITVPARTPGSTVSLRTADEAPTSDADLRPVGADVTASGKTELDGSTGGTHRYWVVWVSRLGPRADGFGATFGTPQVTGPAVD